mmetsp:Transcript_90494/g.141880  ORF Transcript_90494/g.141880 Transcript_90494/m.141880 type:complete len:189 (+) Transcript_90494:74-640(+)
MATALMSRRLRLRSWYIVQSHCSSRYVPSMPLRRCSSQPEQRANVSPSSEESPGSGQASESGGLFGDMWWPTVAHHVQKRLAQRPSGLPEDPLAQGVMSWVEYELARKPSSVAQAAKAQGVERSDDANDSLPVKGGDDDVVDGNTEVEDKRLGPQQGPPVPLPPEAESWRWHLRGRGEIVGPRGDPRG